MHRRTWLGLVVVICNSFIAGPWKPFEEANVCASISLIITKVYNCLFSDMDLRDESYVPEGWLKTTRNERVVFLTQLPNRVVIQSKRMIKDYQKQGRYLGADPEKMDFRQLVISNSSNVVGDAKETCEQMEVDQD